MITVRPQDVFHKVELLRLLTAMADDPLVAASVVFKGGTCASMLGYLDRFSVDLDFDLMPGASPRLLRKQFIGIFKKLHLTVKTESRHTLTFLLSYKSPPGQRNSLKLSILPQSAVANIAKPQYLPEIDRILVCQTIETMFANKLVAPLDRFRKYHTIAGRDFYDMHHFFLNGYRYEPKVIMERTSLPLPRFFTKLTDFVTRHLTQTVLDEDLNALLPEKMFRSVQKSVRTELLTMLTNEIHHV